VRQLVSRVIAGANVRGEVILGDGEEDLGPTRERLASLYPHRDIEPPGIPRSGQVNRGRRAVAGGTADRIEERRTVAADGLVVAGDDGLRRVHEVGAQPAERVGLLARRERGRRKRIAPAEPVPVVHVLAERDDRHAGNGLLLDERPEQAIGRRAAAAPFRREQLDQHGTGGSARALPV
jgi:hypothetical protein